MEESRDARHSEALGEKDGLWWWETKEQLRRPTSPMDEVDFLTIISF